MQQLDREATGEGGSDVKPRSPRAEMPGARGFSLDWRFELPYLVAVIGAAALGLSLAGRHSGWPIGQTFGQDPLLVQIYAAHFRHGDFFPVWSSSDAYGMGSPTPLFYHKAFFFVAGVIFIVSGGALKTTLLVTLAIFMVVGAYGMRLALGVITEERLIQAVGSLGFLFTNWAFVEWLSRGDLAEFSALMVVPWLLYWCLNFVKKRRMSWSIVPTMVVLVDAHNAVALVSILTLAVTGVTFLATSGLTGLRAISRRLIIAVGATALILAPMLLAELEMSRNYDPATKVTAFGATVARNFIHPWWAYFYVPSYRWLSRTNTLLNVQLDFAITAVLVAGLLAVLVRWGRRWVVRSPGPGPTVDGPVVAVLIASLMLYLFLQFRVSLFLYDVLSPFKVITFPYRMMTFIIPLALLLAAVVADWYLRVWRTRGRHRSLRLPTVVAGLWLVALVLLSPVTAHGPAPEPDSFFPNVPFLPVQQLTPSTHMNFANQPGILAQADPLFIEYLPKVTGPDGRELESDEPLYQKLQRSHKEGASLSSVPCSVIERPGTSFEALQITFTVTCRAPTLVALPVSYNSFTTITEEHHGGQTQPVPVLHVATDPRIVIRTHTAGSHTLVVHLPTLLRILF